MVELRKQDHVTPGRLRLERANLATAAQLTGDVDVAVLAVDVLPAEAEDLGETKAGEQHRGDDGPKRVA